MPEPMAPGAAAPAVPTAEAGEAFEARRLARARRVRARLVVDRTIAVLVPLVLWQVLAMTWSGGKWISSPAAVAARVWMLAGDGTLWIHTWETLKEALVFVGGAIRIVDMAAPNAVTV